MKVDVIVDNHYLYVVSLTEVESKFTLAKSSQLPAMIEAEKQSVSDEKHELKRDKYIREKQFWQYYKVG